MPSQSEYESRTPTAPDYMMTRTSTPRPAPSPHATDGDKSKTGRTRTRRRDETRHEAEERGETLTTRCYRHETPHGRYRHRIRHEQDTRMKRDKMTRCYNEKPTTRRGNEKHNETPPRNAKARRGDETARYILKADHWPRKRLSTFSTMREYNTDTRRRTTPSGDIHNTNTITSDALISN